MLVRVNFGWQTNITGVFERKIFLSQKNLTLKAEVSAQIPLESNSLGDLLSISADNVGLAGIIGERQHTLQC